MDDNFWDSDDDFSVDEGSLDSTNETEENDNDSVSAEDSFSDSFGEYLDNKDEDTEIQDNGFAKSKETSQKNSINKGLIIALIALSVVILAVFGVYKFIVSRGTQTKTKTSTKQDVVDIDNSKKSQDNSSGSQSVQTQSGYSNDWAVLDKDADIYNGEFKTVESVFTITEIMILGRNSKDMSGSSKQIKRIFRGSIDGLDGRYEIEVGIDEAKSLSIGDRFRCWYTIGELDGYVIVTGVSHRSYE